jgi:hypothetical protein
MSIRSTCEKGFRVYLAEQHKNSMDKALGKGVVVGGIGAGVAYGIDRVMDWNTPWYYLAGIFVLLTAASLGNGVMTANAEDLDHKEAFDAICAKYEEKDGE